MRPCVQLCPGWKSSWGTFAQNSNANGVSPVKACCVCGGGVRPTSKPTGTTKHTEARMTSNRPQCMNLPLPSARLLTGHVLAQRVRGPWPSRSGVPVATGHRRRPSHPLPRRKRRAPPWPTVPACAFERIHACRCALNSLHLPDSHHHPRLAAMRAGTTADATERDPTFCAREVTLC